MHWKLSHQELANTISAGECMMSLPLFPIANRQPTPMRRRPPRRCRGHERNWKTYCVDRNLDDAWLESLNSLDAFNLISICEGHNADDPRRRRRAHINLRLKDSLLPKDIRGFDAQAEALQEPIRRLFNSILTNIDIELRVRWRPSYQSCQVQPDLVIKIQALHDATPHDMNPETHDWFTSVIPRIQEFDRLSNDLFSQFSHTPSR